ncbi:DUF4314 domain-containing protein [Nocardia sp. CA-107356]|uniref:DUF4314 domain-containing protein n=1 Tax=Nocardia sp. CA-107356 TaxID=3239972 RepID=UPI003D944BB0
MNLEPGDRVRITGIMPNDPDPLAVGATGTVTKVRDSQIDVDWDNGRRLILLDDDPFAILTDTGGEDIEPAGSSEQGS